MNGQADQPSLGVLMHAACDPCLHTRWTKGDWMWYKWLDRAQSGKAWVKAYESTAERQLGTGACIQTMYLVSGLLLPMW